MQIKKLVPRKERCEIADGGGLSIRVLATGAKSWVYRYLFDGNPRRMTLGTYPAVTLAEARKKHGDAVLNLKHGVDPGLV